MGVGELRIAAGCWIVIAVALTLNPTDAMAGRDSSPAQWIWANDADGPNTWVAFRYEFELSSVPTSAPARIAADSKYWLWLNEELVVFEGALKRGPRPDATWIDEIDLAAHLKPGVNCLAVLVWHWHKHGFSHVDSGEGGLLLSLDLGKSTIASGPDWKAMRHPAYLSTNDEPQPNFRLPEHNIHFDARLDELGGWISAGFDDSPWPVAATRGEPPAGPWGELVVREIPMWSFSGIREFERTTLNTDDDEGTVIVADLPYNSQVTAYFEIDAPSGLTIDMRTDNYEFGANNSVRTEYVTRSGFQTFESLGWFNGDEVHFTIPNGVEIQRLGYRESGYNTTFVGRFTSNDPFLNELWKKAARTTYVNMRDGFMDCPDRERAQWWGDVVNEMSQAFYAFDPAAHALVRKAVHDLVEWRKDGVILHSPIPSGTADWELPVQMLAAVGRMGIWQYFLHTGDAETIVDVFNHITNYLDLWQQEPGGLVVQRPGDWQWFDWGSNIDAPVIENAWFALALQGAIEMSVIAGDPAATIMLQSRLGRLRSAFDQEFWTGVSYRSPNHPGPPDDRANALAVVAGLVSEDRYAAIRSVLMTRSFASPYMERFVLEALFLMGSAEGALFRMEDRFSEMVSASPTTLWEHWDRGLGSDNHGWAGGPLYLLSVYVAGLAPQTPGWSRYHVKPQLAHLDHVSASVVSVRGPIQVTHGQSETEHRTDLQSPLGTIALVGVPALGMEGGEVFEVTINDSLVWDHNGYHELPGITFGGVSSGYLMFEVTPGEWSFLARSTPGRLFSDGFESGDLRFWQ